MPTDDIASLASAAQKFIERYHQLDTIAAIVSAMRDDIDSAVADGVNYQTPLVSGVYELHARWPELATDIATLRLLAESYATLLTDLTSKEPRRLFDDSVGLWKIFDEAQTALGAASIELDRVVSTKKPPTYEGWPTPTPRR